MIWIVIYWIIVVRFMKNTNETSKNTTEDGKNGRLQKSTNK